MRLRRRQRRAGLASASGSGGEACRRGGPNRGQAGQRAAIAARRGASRDCGSLRPPVLRSALGGGVMSRASAGQPPAELRIRLMDARCGARRATTRRGRAWLVTARHGRSRPVTRPVTAARGHDWPRRAVGTAGHGMSRHVSCRGTARAHRNRRVAHPSRTSEPGEPRIRVAHPSRTRGGTALSRVAARTRPRARAIKCAGPRGNLGSRARVRGLSEFRIRVLSLSESLIRVYEPFESRIRFLGLSESSACPSP